MKIWRLLDTGPLSPACNMAIDRALLALHACGQSPPTLRLYQWRPPAVSLGYFQQRHDLDLDACQSLGYAVVRRPTGGRAVLHLGDLTYAIVAGIADGMPATVSVAYQIIARGLLQAFRLLGIEAQMGRGESPSPRTDVCFLRCTSGAIVYRRKKLVGSAQAWQGSSLLQHGSIIIKPQVNAWLALLTQKEESREDLQARLAARLTSLEEILGRRLKLEELKEAIRQGMAEALGVKFQPGELSAAEWTLAREISFEEENKYHPLRGPHPDSLERIQGSAAPPGAHPGHNPMKRQTRQLAE